MGVDVLRQSLGVPAYLHKADLPLWEQLQASAQTWLGRRIEALQLPDVYWEDGDLVSVGTHDFTIWHTPGHSPGSISLVGNEVAFTGDTLFAGTIGRTDLPLSNLQDMRSSLQRLLTLPNRLKIYPGHGLESTVAEQKLVNPYFRESEGS
jgi:glyoxylase-like metal-dependent hydrolase (beta-lactamase superfamily II)